MNAPSPFCDACGTSMRRLFSSCAMRVKSGWVSTMEQKYGKQGHPYEDESGRPRGHVPPAPTMRPGPRTTALWRQNEAAMGQAGKAGLVSADEANAVHAARPDR